MLSPSRSRFSSVEAPRRGVRTTRGAVRSGEPSGGVSGQQQQARQRLLNGVQFGIGKQLGERTFLSLTTGLCRLGAAGGQLSPVDLASSIGVKLEQRLGGGYGYALSLEPPLNVLFCETGTDRSFTTTRRQYGFDVFRAWRW